MSLSPLIADFDAARDTEAAMNFWPESPLQTIEELASIETAIFERKDTYTKDEFKEAKAAVIKKCERLKDTISTEFEDYPEMNWQFSLLLSKLGMKKECIPFLEKAAELSPSDQARKRKLASALTKITDDKIALTRAIQIAENATSISPNAKNYRVLAEALFANDAFFDAKDSFIAGANAENSVTDEPGGYCERRAAETLRRKLESPEEALEWAQKAYEIDPENRRNCEEFGLAHFELGNYKKATPFLFYAHTEQPNFRLTLHRLIDCLIKTDKFEQAYDFAINLERYADEREVSIRRQVEVYRAAQWAPDEDLKELEKVIKEEFPDSRQTNEEIGRYFFERGATEKARSYLEIAANAEGGLRANALARMLDECRP
ncbi:MAG: hypothetical protein AB8B83_03655 [Bdellovibrionales bacterium]